MLPSQALPVAPETQQPETQQVARVAPEVAAVAPETQQAASPETQQAAAIAAEVAAVAPETQQAAAPETQQAAAAETQQAAAPEAQQAAPVAAEVAAVAPETQQAPAVAPTQQVQGPNAATLLADRLRQLAMQVQAVASVPQAVEDNIRQALLRPSTCDFEALLANFGGATSDKPQVPGATSGNSNMAPPPVPLKNRAETSDAPMPTPRGSNSEGSIPMDVDKARVFGLILRFYKIHISTGPRTVVTSYHTHRVSGLGLEYCHGHILTQGGAMVFILMQARDLDPLDLQVEGYCN